MAALQQSYLGIIEIADYEYLVDTHGTEPAKLLYDEFVKRVQTWLRPGDQSKIQKNNRFLVVLKGVASAAQLELAAAKLARLFEQPYQLLGQPALIDIHAGFALLDGSSSDVKKEVQQARMALRQAKRANDFYQIFSTDTQRRQDEHSKLIAALVEAVERGEFVLYYQPKMHAGYGNLVGAEALLRWYTQDKKILSPHHFMDVAENHEVIRPITMWAIKSTAAQIARWPSQLGASVNVPPSLLLDDEILAVISDVIDLHGIDPARLTLEVTENIMISSPEQVLSQLSALRKLGVKISIDDFGTGYSSLAYFRDLPADELKIDKNFVLPMLKSKKDESIVKTVIDLAHNFSMRVVAEGVESDAIARRLSELGCDHLQGFLYDEPLPIEEFDKRHLV